MLSYEIGMPRPHSEFRGFNMLTDRFDHALAYASRIHRDQTRKGTAIPYISHLMGTAAIALENGADEDQAIAALLHDAVEDQGGADRLIDVRARFGVSIRWGPRCVAC
jgi:(p)ppGpp synthase/HD superfamily hydrolase